MSHRAWKLIKELHGKVVERLSEGLDGDGGEAEKEENAGKQHNLGVLR